MYRAGVYYKLRVSSDDQGTISEGETLALPLRSISSESPDRAISLTRDIFLKGVADTAILAVRQVIPLSSHLIDIGTGVPDELPIVIDAA